jgi:hypothetical protein
MIGKIPLHAIGCLFRHTLIVPEEVAGGSTVIHFIVLVNVVSELTGGILLFDSLSVRIIPVLFDE